MMGPAIDDRDTVRQVLAGHHEAYADLVRKYQARILRLCTSLLSDPTQAEDAAQEAFIKAFRSLTAFRGQASFGTWLYRIATNHCRDLLRHRARHRAESWEAMLEDHGETLQQLFASTPDPHAPIIAADLIEQILGRLPPEPRALLTLREVEGLSYQEIAQTLGYSVEAVRARLHRARQDLQEIVRHVAPARHV